MRFRSQRSTGAGEAEENEDEDQVIEEHHGRQRTLSIEEKESIITSVMSHGKGIREAASELYLSRSSVSRVVKEFEETGRIRVARRGGDRRSINDQAYLTGVKNFLMDNPSYSVRELVNSLNEMHQVNYAVRTVGRWIHDNLMFTLKIAHRETVEYNSPFRLRQREEWCREFQIQGKSLHRMVVLDESGFNLTKIRTQGRAPVGRRPEVPRPPREANLTLIAAMTSSKVIASNCLLGAINSTRFSAWLENSLFPAMREAGFNSVLMDNASFHKSGITSAVFQRNNIQMNLLPPYSPFLNPIELLFSNLKRFVARQDFIAGGTIEEYIEAEINNTTSENCEGWYQHCQENFIKALNHEELGHEYH